jgi:hypothetical protein
LKTGAAASATDPQKKEQYNMKHLKIAFGLVVVAGMMAVATSSAIAAGPIWVTCLPRPGAGHFEDSHCTKAKENGGWETSELTKTVEVTSSGSLELEDSAATGGKVIIKCTGTDLGTVGSGGSDSTTAISATGCAIVKKEHGSCSETGKLTAEPLNLPWSTRLEEKNSGELRDTITSLLSGKNPGWNVKCVVGGIFEVADECVGRTSTAVKANRSEGSVEGEFEAKSEAASCSLGNSTSGHVRGIVITKLRMSNGELLAFWPLSTAEKT